jgi:hypothetical protein
VALMTLGVLALELIALILVFAADDVAQHRGPVATWTKSLQVIAATTLAVALVTWLQASRLDLL